MIATTDYELVTESGGRVDRAVRAQFRVRGSEAAVENEFLWMGDPE